MLNGLGIGLATALFAGLPAIFKAQGLTSAEAGRYMLFVMAGLAVVTAVIMQVGPQGRHAHGHPFARSACAGCCRSASSQGRENPRLLVCYAGSFISRADLTLVATFVSLWLQRVARDEGLDGPEALAKAGLMFALIQGSALLWAPVAGALLDRFNRLACVVGALFLGAAGYTLLGLQDHPFAPHGLCGLRARGHWPDERDPVGHRPAGPGDAR